VPPTPDEIQAARIALLKIVTEQLTAVADALNSVARSLTMLEAHHVDRLAALEHQG